MAFKILAVDDDIDVVETLKRRLKAEGYEPFTACDGKEALEIIQNNDPDIILLDLVLPQVNGYEVLRKVKTEFKDKWRPVIVISAKNELDSVTDAYDLDADLYLIKPCTIMEILVAIKKMVDMLVIAREQEKEQE